MADEVCVIRHDATELQWSAVSNMKVVIATSTPFSFEPESPGTVTNSVDDN